MSDENLDQTLKKILEKARRSLSASELLASEGNYDFSSSRTYYAVLYAMQAMLLTKNLSASSHSGVFRLFNQHFIKSGIFEKEDGKLISKLSRKRQAGDYKFNFFFDPTEISNDIKDATKFVDAVENFLRTEGFLN